jgi:hypothetical protein
VLYGLLFDIAAETLRTISADPRHVGSRIGATLVVHTWGSTLTHHPTSTASSPAAGCRPTRNVGAPAGRASSCRYACSRGCSDGVFSSNSAGRRRLNRSSRHSSAAAVVQRCASSRPSRAANRVVRNPGREVRHDPRHFPLLEIKEHEFALLNWQDCG